MTLLSEPPSIFIALHILAISCFSRLSNYLFAQFMFVVLFRRGVFQDQFLSHGITLY